MSRLTRKHNNLKKAQARFEKVSRRGKQFQLQFDRQHNNRGRYKTSVNIVRGEKQYHGNNRGILHKIVNLKYRVNGDTPSITRTINATQPTTFIGKSLKATAQATNFVVHDAVKTAVDAGLTAETVGIKVTDTASREIVNKARQKYTREAVDDYHRGTFATLKIGADAVKGTHKHFKLKKQYRLEKAKYRLKKAENDIFKAENFKPNKRKILRKLIDNKEEFQLNKSKFKNSDKTNLDRAFYIRRKQKFKQNKRELNQELNKLKSEKKFRNLTLTNQKKIAKNSNPGLLITKPVEYTGNRLKASAWQKAVNEDQDNDVLHAIDSTKRRVIAPAVQKISKPQRLQNQQKKRDKISDKDSKSQEKLRKKDNRLKEKHDKPKKKKKAQNKKKHQSSFGERFKDGLKAFLRFVKNIYTAEVKTIFLILLAVILLLLLLVALLVMMFSGVSSSSGFILGTYAAQDYDLSEAEKYYTKLAWDMNENIRLVGDSSTWKTGLSKFGVNTSGMKDTPDTFQWGNSTVYNWNPTYDFDTYKLWCFLCAYYYDFDAADNGDIKYWKYGSGTESLIKEIFDAEYEFVSNYDNTSHWEYRYHFNSQGYYSIDGSGVSGSYGYIDISYPDALPMGAVTNGKTLYYDLSNGEVLNYNDGYSATGWYLKNQYVDDYDNSGTKFGKWYVNGETCGYGIWENGVLVTPVPYVIPEQNWCSFLQKYDWKTDCRLYYSVKQKKTFDKVIEDKLKSMSKSAERLQYYNLLIGTDSGQMYGNHQTLRNMFGTQTIHDYSITNGFGYDMQNWNSVHCKINTLHEGLDVVLNSNSRIYAPFDCKITKVDTSTHSVVLRKDDVEYWYDGTGGTKRDTEVYLYNVNLKSGLSEGDTIKVGDYFANSTGNKNCDGSISDNNTSHYVHIKVKIDTDGYGWDFIDPLLVLY